MRLLTSDRATRNQLSLLLRDLGYTPKFYDSVDEFCLALVDAKQNTPALVDLHYNLSEDELSSISSHKEALNIIGFVCYEHSISETTPTPSNTFGTSIIVPSNAQRAKLRLKNALRGGSARGLSSASTRAPFKLRKRTSNISPPINKKRRNASTEDVKEPRYLITDSRRSKSLFEALKQSAQSEGLFFLEAKEDAEFELIAREFNYLSNMDASTLYIVEPDDLRIDYLEKLEREANKSRTLINCYVGRTDDLNGVAANELKLFGEYLCNLRNPHARLILSHEKGAEELFQEGVAEHVEHFRKKAERIQIPSLIDREEDIATICQMTLSHLRLAHPFLYVRRISKEAELYLSENRQHYSYTKLVRILRNAIALCKRTALTVEDIKNYGESDMTTQHLLETMADETYFPQSANF